MNANVKGSRARRARVAIRVPSLPPAGDEPNAGGPPGPSPDGALPTSAATPNDPGRIDIEHVDERKRSAVESALPAVPEGDVTAFVEPNCAGSGEDHVAPGLDAQ